MEDSDVCEIHQLAQFCTREWLSSFDRTQRWRQKFAALIAREFPDGRIENLARCQTLFSYVTLMFESDLAQEELLGD
jgi:hypothetical protein